MRAKCRTADTEKVAEWARTEYGVQMAWIVQLEVGVYKHGQFGIFRTSQQRG